MMLRWLWRGLLALIVVAGLAARRRAAPAGRLRIWHARQPDHAGRHQVAAHHRAGEPGRAMGLRQRRRPGPHPARLPRDVQPQLARLAHQGHRRQPRAAGAGDGAVRHGAALIPFRDRNDMNLVIPAKAGIQTTRAPSAWIPAFAGMTMVNVLRWNGMRHHESACPRRAADQPHALHRLRLVRGGVCAARAVAAGRGRAQDQCTA